MEPTSVTNTTAQSHPFTVGARTFESLEAAGDFAGRSAEQRQLATAVFDRRTGNLVRSFPVAMQIGGA